MQYLLLVIIKILDNIIITAKTIATYQNKKILSSLLVTISQVIFYFIITRIVDDNTILAIIIISISSGIGNYIAFALNDRFKKDDVWGNVITSNDSSMLIELCTLLKNNKIKYLLMDTYNRRFEKTFTVQAYTKTKEESKLIDDYLEKSNSKYLRMINGIEVKRNT